MAGLKNFKRSLSRWKEVASPFKMDYVIDYSTIMFRLHDDRLVACYDEFGRFERVTWGWYDNHKAVYFYPVMDKLWQE